ncbi:MAG: hypothetical protein KF690_07665 [Bacteroidetes bacterium]|nr:hypothetical protein [Bacteroidota bacterium]
MPRTLFFSHKSFLAKGSRDELLATLRQTELRVTSGAFKGTLFATEPKGDDQIAIFPTARKTQNRNGLLQAALTIQTGVAGSRVRLSTGIPLVLVIAFAFGFVTQMGVYIFLAKQQQGQVMEMVAPMLGASIAVMMAVMLWIYKGLGRQLERMLIERLQLRQDVSPQPHS